MLGSHTTASSTVAALVRSSALSLSSQVTIYGWSIKQVTIDSPSGEAVEKEPDSESGRTPPPNAQS
jgi:hypothetical protein